MIIKKEVIKEGKWRDGFSENMKNFGTDPSITQRFGSSEKGKSTGQPDDSSSNEK